MERNIFFSRQAGAKISREPSIVKEGEGKKMADWKNIS